MCIGSPELMTDTNVNKFYLNGRRRIALRTLDGTTKYTHGPYYRN